MPLNRRDGGRAGVEHPGSEVAVVARAVAIARAFEPLFSEEGEWRWRPVKCSEFLNELTNYLDGALDARTKSELDDHLAWCHNCYVVCDTTRKTIEIYRNSELYELPDDLRTRLRMAIMSKCSGHKSLTRRVAERTPRYRASLDEFFESTSRITPPTARKCIIPKH